MQRVRDLPDERLITPPRALLDDHQPHEQRHRDRRPPMPTRRHLPPPSDRRQKRRIAQQLIKPGEIPRQFTDLDRQRLVKQRLDLLTHKTQHRNTSRIDQLANTILTPTPDRETRLFPEQIATRDLETRTNASAPLVPNQCAESAQTTTALLTRT